MFSESSFLQFLQLFVAMVLNHLTASHAPLDTKCEVSRTKYDTSAAPQ